MSSKLKFRAWIPSQKIFVHFDLRSCCLDNGCFWRDEYQEAIVEQFAGLHDKNGREIYEGDVVRFAQRYRRYRQIEVVEWLEGAAGFDPFISADDVDDANTVPRPEDCEIIGNLHEHPDLLVGA